MGNKRLEGDFYPVEIRGYTLKSMQTYSDYTVIAMNESHKVIAVGKEAYQYADDFERAGMGKIFVYSTFKRNVVAEFLETVTVVKWIFKNILPGIKYKIFKPTIAVCIPFELTSVELKAFQDVFYVVGGRKVTIFKMDFEDNKKELAKNYNIVIGIIPNKL
ncbi:rod shape-determining protein [Lacrimispora sp.]|uniref:rod shape-determining protein n=1 Tax=Lacrimispora sp. TaxID=2719234 RepID=UPI0032E3F570